MEKILVIGGDRLHSIEHMLKNAGFSEIIHVTGRKNSNNRLRIPTSAKAVLIFTDFVNHSLTNHIKSQAKQRKLPIVFCKRSYFAIGKAFSLAQ